MKLLLAVLFSANLFAGPVWIVGESYVGLYDGKLRVQRNINPESYAINETTCELWVEDSGNLKRLALDFQVEEFGSTGRVLHADASKTLALGSHQNLVTRNSLGEIISDQAIAWSDGVTELVRTDNGYASLHLDSDKKNLWLHFLCSDFNVSQRIAIAKSEVLWGENSLLWDKQNQALWIGYSASSPEHFYTPFVQARRLDGSLIVKHAWPDRGLFFDFCLDAAGKLIAGRDVPSNSGFTVPVYSFLEKLSLAGEKAVIYALDENYFPDTFLCGENALIVERSIFGSDGSRLVRRNAKGSGEVIAKLPGPVQKLLACR